MNILKKKKIKERTCSKFPGYVNFNIITREGKPEIPIKSYKDQWRDHMIRNGMWDIVYLTDPCNKYKTWYLLIHKYTFTLDYVKLHVNSLHKVYKADKYMVRNLTWSGEYPQSTLSYAPLHNVMKLVPLPVTGPDSYVATMIIIL